MVVRDANRCAATIVKDRPLFSQRPKTGTLIFTHRLCPTRNALAFFCLDTKQVLLASQQQSTTVRHRSADDLFAHRVFAYKLELVFHLRDKDRAVFSRRIEHPAGNHWRGVSSFLARAAAHSAQIVSPLRGSRQTRLPRGRNR